MLSDHLTSYTLERYEARRPLLASVADAADAAITACADVDEATLLRYLYATLPITDCIDVAPEVLASYARHAAFLRREVAWAQSLGEGMFVHYVLCPRINNEPLTDCRHTFWDALRERVGGLAPYDAVREVNYWCCEMATSQLTDDRTQSPLSVLASGSGRCGEESTFLVTALRSIGIPARQVYATWWAHCDDNHAWVEAYTGDGWHYLGACEPEEELDRGWFTNASGRAPMEETRLFSDYRDDSMPEPDAGSVGSARLLDVTASYALSEQLRIRVTRNGAPVRDATVCAQVLNMAGWMPATTIQTDASGIAGLQIGLCTLRVRASAEGLLGMAVVDTREVHEVEVELVEPGRAVGELGSWYDIDVAAPADHPAPSHAQTPEQDVRARERKAACDAARRKRVEGFACEAARLAERWPGSQHAFACAFSNAPQVAAFLEADDEADRLELLGTLTDKDFRDLRSDILESHLAHARELRETAEARLRAQGMDEAAAHDAYVRYVLCPRFKLEELSDYRPFVLDFYDDGQKAAFVTDPRRLWDQLCLALSFDGHEGLAGLVGTTAGALSSGIASATTRDQVFVAVCRSLGVAARLNPSSSHPEFMEGGRFVPVEEQDAPVLTNVTFTCADAANAPTYFTTWSIGRLESFTAPNGFEALDFRLLDHTGATFEDGRLTLGLEDGTYRVITTTRLPDGDQQASELVFCVDEDADAEGVDDGTASAGSETENDATGTGTEGTSGAASCAVSRTADGLVVALRQRTPNLRDMLNVIKLPAFTVADGEGTQCAPTLGSCGNGILAFAQEGMEPTEHLLNELRDRADDLRAAGMAVTVVVRDEAALSDPTLSRTRAALPEIGIRYDDFSELPERLARRTYANPELLPLTLLVTSSNNVSSAGNAAGTKPTGNGDSLTSLYSTAGYNVGTVDLLLRLSALKRA